MATPIGIVLAAGASVRMGEPKQLLPYRNSTILKATIGAFTSSRLDDVVVVIGSSADLVRSSLQSVDAAIVQNAEFRLGNASSLRAAVDKAPAAAAFVLAAGDLPTITTNAIDALVDVWERDEPWAAVTQYRDRVAHPFLLSSEAVQMATLSPGPNVLWKLLVESKDARVTVVATDRNAPADINTPEDFARLTADDDQ
jgi:molybdenum cofactor cytidylyltransferase